MVKPLGLLRGKHSLVEWTPTLVAFGCSVTSLVYCFILCCKELLLPLGPLLKLKADIGACLYFIGFLIICLIFFFSFGARFTSDQCWEPSPDASGSSWLITEMQTSWLLECKRPSQVWMWNFIVFYLLIRLAEVFAAENSTCIIGNQC